MTRVSRSLVLANRYLDSVALLRLSADLAAVNGVDAATAVMATPANLERARENGITIDGPASPNDLFVGVVGTEVACDEALVLASSRLSAPKRDESYAATGPEPARSLDQFVRRGDAAELALISVPGPYAAAEAGKALDLGMHVMIFSDNVTVHDEIELKTSASARGLLLMGPDCGTAIINGVPLGFANVVRRGPIGVVGASGTGMQEVTSRIHRLGLGVSQAIGCGGRDLSANVGARTMLQGIAMLADDPATSVIVLVSKPPAAEVLVQVIAAAKAAISKRKRVVASFVGLNEGALDGSGIVVAPTLAAAADLAVGRVEATARSLPDSAPNATGTTIRGAFVGGTFCYEAWSLLSGRGIEADRCSLVDFGDDEFTIGRPHPMIDPTFRDRWVAESLDDPSTAVVIVDVVLGHGSHLDPVAELTRIIAKPRANGPVVIAHVCGTELDPQGRDSVVARLGNVGALVADSNAEAVVWAADVVGAVRP